MRHQAEINRDNRVLIVYVGYRRWHVSPEIRWGFHGINRMGGQFPRPVHGLSPGSSVIHNNMHFLTVQPDHGESYARRPIFAAGSAVALGYIILLAFLHWAPCPSPILASTRSGNKKVRRVDKNMQKTV